MTNWFDVACDLTAGRTMEATMGKPRTTELEITPQEILRAEAYNELQAFLLKLQEAKDLRTADVVHLVLDAAKAWTGRQ